MAVAAIELAENYRRQNRAYAALARWLPAAMIAVFGAIAIPAVLEGDELLAGAYALIVVGSLGHLLLNPATRPRSVARSLTASRRVVSAERS